LTTVGSSRNAMTFIGPSQREQTITSTAKTRLSRAAQSRRYADRGGDGFGVGAGDGATSQHPDPTCCRRIWFGNSVEYVHGVMSGSWSAR